MTVKEIAMAVNKDPSTVARWVEKTSCKMQDISCKVQEAKATSRPADYTLDETCQIIETGLGKNASDLFRMSANAGIPESNARLDRLEIMFEKLLLAIVETRPQIAQPQKHLQLEQPVQDYYSIMGYSRIIGETIAYSRAVRIGKLAVFYSNENKIEVRKVTDERFGYVGSYRIDVLQAVWNQ
jgi:hypothetical protein